MISFPLELVIIRCGKFIFVNYKLCGKGIGMQVRKDFKRTCDILIPCINCHYEAVTSIGRGNST